MDESRQDGDVLRQGIGAAHERANCGGAVELEHLTDDQRVVVRIFIETGDFREKAARLGITRKALERRLVRVKKRALEAV